MKVGGRKDGKMFTMKLMKDRKEHEGIFMIDIFALRRSRTDTKELMG